MRDGSSMRFLVLMALLAPTAALAQDEPGSARTSSATALRPPPGPTVEDHPAFRLYHLAFEALAAGQVDEASRLLRQLVTTQAEHPLARRAQQVLAKLDAGPINQVFDVPRKAAAPGIGRDSAPTAFSRAELVVAQTLHGIGLGAEVCIVAGCDDARAIGATVVVGGGLGLGLSLLLTSESGITPGHTAALNTGTLWGAATGFMISGLINPVSDDAELIPGLMIGGQLLGLGVGELSWRLTHASSGDISLAGSTGFWSGFLATMVTLGAFNGDPDEPEPVFGIILASSLTGLVAGGFLADRFPINRGHALVIDGGGVIGALTGLGAALIVRAEDSAPYFILTGIGAASGLVLTTFLTRDWDLDIGREASFNIIPTKGGAIVGFSTPW